MHTLRELLIPKKAFGSSLIMAWRGTHGFCGGSCMFSNRGGDDTNLERVHISMNGDLASGEQKKKSS